MNAPSMVRNAREETQAEYTTGSDARIKRLQRAPAYELRLIKNKAVADAEGKRYGKIRGPRDCYDMMRPYYEGMDREVFIIVMLDTKNQVIGTNIVSIGDLSSAITSPREVYKAAILANSANIICMHNHPSGEPTPSSEDAIVTRRLQECGEVLGIAVLDHVVCGDGRFVSMKEAGLL
jgi:DNA repair protein RadC